MEKQILSRGFLIIALLLLLIPATASADAPYQMLWWKQFSPNTYGDSDVSVAAGGGNVFVAGTATYDVIVAKFSAATGEKLWEKQFGTSAIDEASGIAVDASGNIFVTGSTTGALEEGKANAGANDFFIAKLDGASGQLLWVKQFGTSTFDYSTSIAVDGEGNAVVTGGTAGALEEGKANAGGVDIFAAKFSGLNGDKLWLKQIGTPEADFATGVAVDGDGSAFVTGATFGALEEGTPAGGSSDIFVLKYSAAGALAWVREMGTPQNDSATSIAVDASGNLFISGGTEGALQQGAVSAGYVDMFVARMYTATGQLQWVRQLGSAEYDAGTGVTVVGGTVFVAGSTFGALEEGKANAGGDDVFVAAFTSSTGETLWVKQVGTQANEDSYGIASLGNSVFLAGYTSDPSDGHIFLAKFGPSRLSPLDQIVRIVQKFDAGVLSGAITGAGTGNSADRRRQALRNMLTAVTKKIAGGEETEACGQLAAIYQKMDGVAPPQDFIQGSGVADLAADVASLRSSLGCNSPTIGRTMLLRSAPKRR